MRTTQNKSEIGPIRLPILFASLAMATSTVFLIFTPCVAYILLPTISAVSFSIYFLTIYMIVRFETSHEMFATLLLSGFAAIFSAGLYAKNIYELRLFSRAIDKAMTPNP
jgi:hypothetical protein